jgi:hypothetical protein
MVITCPVITDAVDRPRQDVSRLVDICRQCIAFDNLGDMLACLRVIGGDDEAEVVCVKNRMALG